MTVVKPAHSIGIAVLVVACLVVPPVSASSQSFAGLELTDALLALKAGGLPIVFTSEVVRPGMRVAVEPTATDPRQQLDEILAPFGLRALELDGGLLVVVPAGVATDLTICCSITGRVRDRETRSPIPGAVVLVIGTRRTATADDLGRFSIPIAPGRHSVTATARGFVDESMSDLRVAPGANPHVDLLLSPAPFLAQKIEVFAGQGTPSPEPLATTWTLGHDELDRVPQLGDPLRGLLLAPGTAAGDLTARISVRGGRSDETKIVLDGQELYDAYHLKDYESSLTIVPSQGLANANLLSGGLSAAHGDRMGGVVDLRTRGSTDPTTRLSFSTLDALAQSSGAFDAERGGWLFSARRGLVDVATDVSGDESPSFWDVFSKADYRAGARNSFRAHALVAHDEVQYEVLEEGEAERLFTDYTTEYAWITHDLALGSAGLVQTTASWSRSTRDRNGGEVQDEKEFTVSDERDLDILSATQGWNWQIHQEHVLRFGVDVRKFDADFDYVNDVEPELVIVAPFSPPRETTTEYKDELAGTTASGWISDRMTRGNVAVELGMRYDQHSLPDENLWSPRAGFAWQIAPRGTLLANWGVYHQSQRPYELQVEDGETELSPAEKSEQWSVGYEHLFETGRPLQSLHVELFRRDISNPRLRYENLLEPINRFHEVEPDRVQIAPDSSKAEGIELVLRGRPTTQVGWWLAYTYAESTDTIDGEIVPRALDQTHAATLTADYSFRRNWNLNLAWVYHAGWPTTPVISCLVENPDGESEIELEFGKLNSERMPEYHRMDLRLSRDWQLRTGRLSAFLELRNVYNRNNVAGYDVSVDADAGTVELIPEYWPGLVPVVGIVWEICGPNCGRQKAEGRRQK